jgi:hypothetical protein
MRLPRPRGPVSAHVVHALGSGAPFEPDEANAVEDVLGDDAQLALWTLLQLHFRDFDDAPADREWDPGAVALRGRLEGAFEERFRELVSEPVERAREQADDVADQVFALVDAADGPSLAAYLQREASQEEVLDFLRQRSVYHLKESDAHSFVLPRVRGAVKVALAELQYDEYGAGRPDRLHAHLFALGMAALGLDPAEGAYADQAPLPVLEQNNAMSLFGLHRRLRGASLGHLAAFEATSSLPSRKMAQGFDRLGLAPEMRAYYEEHIEADAVHEQLAVRTICGALVDAEPETEADVWFGAFTCLDLEDRVAAHLLDRWGVA